MEKMTTWTVLLVMLGVAMVTEQQDVFQLDMAPSSVDDMYDGCRKNMLPLVQKYERYEKKNSQFSWAWKAAEKYYNRKWNPRYGGRPDHVLMKQQIMAVHAYTLPNIYKQFNQAVRTQRSTYKTRFWYHTLHFFLTTAIQALKRRPQCLTTYRRTSVLFSQNVLNKQIRFGSFTSSSAGRYPNPHFGQKSCFKIYTCFGADISRYSKFENEKEVLIPPYEVFKVIRIQRRSHMRRLPCEVVYEVRSTGRPYSTLNCSLLRAKKSPKYVFKKTAEWLKKCMGSFCFGK